MLIRLRKLIGPYSYFEDNFQGKYVERIGRVEDGFFIFFEQTAVFK